MTPRPDHDAASALQRIAFTLLRDLGRARRRLVRDDPGREALHDYRVALRRIRSVLRALRPVLRPEEAPRLEKVLRRIGRGTSQSRDLEVLDAWVHEAESNVLPEIAAVLEAELRRAGRKASEDLASVLRPRLHAEVVDLFDAVFRDREAILGPGTRRFGDVASEVALPFVDAALADAHALLEAPTMPALHGLRISLKRVRYVLEAFVGGWPAGVLRLRTTLERLQDQLGRVHDADVHAQWVVDTLLLSERRRLRALRRDLALREIHELRDVLGQVALAPALVEAIDALLETLAAERERVTKLAVRTLRRGGLPGLERLRTALSAPSVARRLSLDTAASMEG